MNEFFTLITNHDGITSIIFKKKEKNLRIG